MYHQVLDTPVLQYSSTTVLSACLLPIGRAPAISSACHWPGRPPSRTPANSSVSGGAARACMLVAQRPITACHHLSLAAARYQPFPIRSSSGDCAVFGSPEHAEKPCCPEFRAGTTRISILATTSLEHSQSARVGSLSAVQRSPSAIMAAGNAGLYKHATSTKRYLLTQPHQTFRRSTSCTSDRGTIESALNSTLHQVPVIGQVVDHSHITHPSPLVRTNNCYSSQNAGTYILASFS